MLKKSFANNNSKEQNEDRTLSAIRHLLCYPEQLNIILGKNKTACKRSASLRKHHQHYHLEMFITLTGAHSYWMANKIYNVKAGDVFVISEGVDHQQGYPKEAKKFIDIWFIRMDKYRFCAHEWNFLKKGNTRGYTPRYFILEGAAVEQFAFVWDKIITEGEMDDFALSRLKHSICGMLFMFVDMIERTAHQKQNTPDHAVIIAEIQNYIEKNIAADLSLKVLSHIAGFDSFYFHKLFKKQTGEALHSYVNRIRFKKACSLLEKGHSAKSVAEELGISSPFYFSRFFKRFSGMAPGKWQTRKLKK